MQDKAEGERIFIVESSRPGADNSGVHWVFLVFDEVESSGKTDERPVV
jgi:hypothetical protein